MGDIGVYCGGAGGPAWLKQPVELSPYETDYAVTEVVCGAEPIGSSWEWGRADLLTSIRYSFLGGSEINNGSHRHGISGDVGLRTRLWKFAVDLGAGAGYAHTAFDFGKGVPLPNIDAATIQVRVGVGIDLCWGKGTCITPYAEFAHEWGVAGQNYNLPMVLGGIRFGVQPGQDD